MGNPIETAIKLLSSAHVATDLIWERSDCVEALKKLTKSSQLDNEIDRIVEWAEDLCGVGHDAWDTIDPRLVASAILEAADNFHAKFEPSCFADFQENHKKDRGCDDCPWLEKCTLNEQQRTWVGLTDEEIFETHKQVDSMQYLTFGKAIEAKLKEKNNG